MVVSYKLEPLTYAIASRLVKSPYISLPNLIAGADVIPERIQKAATPETLAGDAERALFDPDYRDRQQSVFYRLHRELQVGAAETAASTLARLIEGKGELR